MNRRQVLGASVAIAAATLLVGRATFADETKAADTKKPAAKVKCQGGNSCKGKGACGSADGKQSCAGKNECKGKGWVMTSSADCAKNHGTVVPEEKKKS
jgi:hypothetical protein